MTTGNALSNRKKRPKNPRTLDDMNVAYPPHPGRTMTEQEFLDWMKDLTRAEWDDGEVIIFSPVGVEHAEIHSWLLCILGAFVESRDLGRVSGSGYMIRLPGAKTRRRPDIFFVANSHLDAFGQYAFEGPPDLIIEIVSPESTTRDYRDKFKTYEITGVREYWIIDPLSKRAEANELVKGRYRTLEPKEGVLRSKAIKGFFLRPEWCWMQPLPKIATILRELSSV